MTHIRPATRQRLPGRAARLASTVWASVQLFAGVLILLLIKFRFALDLDTLVLLAGFCFWGVLGALLFDHGDGGGSPSR